VAKNTIDDISDQEGHRGLKWTWQQESKQVSDQGDHLTTSSIAARASLSVRSRVRPAGMYAGGFAAGRAGEGVAEKLLSPRQPSPC
jgi:hypothetical protein